MDTRWKAIFSVLVIILCLTSVFLYFAIGIEKQHLDQLVGAREESARLLMETIMDSTSSRYKSRIKSFTRIKASKSREAMIRAFAERNRESLLAQSLPLFETLKKENPYFATIGWALPDLTVFLRVHKPDFFGDNFSARRPDVLEALARQKQVSGFEVGYSGMQYRVVQPILYQGQLQGTVQFGIQAKMFLDALQQKIGGRPVMAVIKERADKSKFYQLPEVDCHHYVVSGQDISLFQQVIEKFDFTADHQRFDIDGTEYIFLTALVMRDFKQQPIGKIIIPLDISKEVQHNRHIIILAVVITIGLLLLAFFLLYVSFGVMIQKIMVLNENLEQKNVELAAAKEHVEQQVEERTAELLAANRKLRKEMEERVRAEKEKSDLEIRLQHSQKMEAIGTLAGGIAHDFNNILSAIIGYTELSLLDAPAGSRLKEDLQHIAKAGKRAKELVRQILTFSRQAEMRRQPLKIGLIVKEALKLLRASLPTTISIEQYIDTQDDYVSADATQIHQIVMNLCTNAAHAMADHGGILTVKLTLAEVSSEESDRYDSIEPGVYIQLSVSDTGIGMGDEMAKRIFEPFFTTKEVGEGTGMGLAVVHGIVQALGGTIQVESVLGEGSTFSVLLPQCDSSSDEGRGDFLVDFVGGNEKILLVDDEEEVRRPTKKMLEKLGYMVFTCANGPEALEVFQEQGDFKLVITDFTMPKMTGLELAAELFRLKPDLPIIMCTGYSSGVSEEKALAAGIKRFYLKPLLLSQVSKAVRQVLDDTLPGKSVK